MIKKVWNHDYEAAVEYCAQVMRTSTKKLNIVTLLTWNIQVDALVRQKMFCCIVVNTAPQIQINLSTDCTYTDHLMVSHITCEM